MSKNTFDTLVGLDLEPSKFVDADIRKVVWERCRNLTDSRLTTLRLWAGSKFYADWSAYKVVETMLASSDPQTVTYAFEMFEGVAFEYVESKGGAWRMPPGEYAFSGEEFQRLSKLKVWSGTEGYRLWVDTFEVRPYLGEVRVPYDHKADSEKASGYKLAWEWVTEVCQKYHTTLPETKEVRVVLDTMGLFLWWVHYDTQDCLVKTQIRNDPKLLSALVQSFLCGLSEDPPRVYGEGTLHHFVWALLKSFPDGLDPVSYGRLLEVFGEDFAVDYSHYRNKPEKLINGVPFNRVRSLSTNRDIPGVVEIETSSRTWNVIEDTIVSGSDNTIIAHRNARVRVLGKNNTILCYPGADVSFSGDNNLCLDPATPTGQLLSHLNQHPKRDELLAEIRRFILRFCVNKDELGLQRGWSLSPRGKRLLTEDKLQLLDKRFVIEGKREADIFVKSNVWVSTGSTICLRKGSKQSQVYLETGAHLVLNDRMLNPKVRGASNGSIRYETPYKSVDEAQSQFPVRIVENEGGEWLVVEAAEGEYVVARGKVFVVAHKGSMVDLHKGSAAVDVAPGSSSIMQDSGTIVTEFNHPIHRVVIGHSDKAVPHGCLQVATSGECSYGGGVAVILNDAVASNGRWRFPKGFVEDHTFRALEVDSSWVQEGSRKDGAGVVESKEGNSTAMKPTANVPVTEMSQRLLSYVRDGNTPVSRRLHNLAPEGSNALDLLSAVVDNKRNTYSDLGVAVEFLKILDHDLGVGPLSGPELTELAILMPTFKWHDAYGEVFGEPPLEPTLVDDYWDSDGVIGKKLRDSFLRGNWEYDILPEENETAEAEWESLKFQETARTRLAAFSNQFRHQPDAPWWYGFVKIHARDILIAAGDELDLYPEKVIQILDKSDFSFVQKLHLISVLSFGDEVIDEIFTDTFITMMEEEFELLGIPLPYTAVTTLAEASVHPITGSVTFDGLSVARSLKDEFEGLRADGETLVPTNKGELAALFDSWVDAGIVSAAQGRFLGQVVGTELFDKKETLKKAAKGAESKDVSMPIETSSLNMPSNGVPSLRPISTEKKETKESPEEFLSKLFAGNLGKVDLSTLVAESNKKNAKVPSPLASREDFIEKLKKTLQKDPMMFAPYYYAIESDSSGELRVTKLDLSSTSGSTSTGSSSTGTKEFGADSGSLREKTPATRFDPFAEIVESSLKLDRERLSIQKSQAVQNQKTSLLNMIRDFESATDDRDQLKLLQHMKFNALRDLYGELLGPDARQDLDELHMDLSSAERLAVDEVAYESSAERLAVDEVAYESPAENRKTTRTANKREDTRNMSMSDRLGYTLKEDAKQIALRTGVKKTRAMLTETISAYIAKRSIPQMEGELDGDYELRLKSESGGIVKFLSSPEGQGLMAFLVGMAWPLMEDQIEDPDVLEYGGLIAQEIRVQGGSDVLEGVVDEVVGPLMLMLKHEVGNLMKIAKPMEKKLKHHMQGSKGQIHYDHVSPELESAEAKATALQAEIETLKAQLSARG